MTQVKLDFDPMHELLNFLARTPAVLAGFASGLSDAELRWGSSADRFSILENICHLRDLELQGYAKRIERILNENEPELPDFDGARVAAEGNYNAEYVSTALEVFRVARNANLEKLKAAVGEGLSRTGSLEGVGQITLPRLAEMMREHDEGHLEDLRVLRQQLERHRSSATPP